jgi:hypothetical protein
MVVGSATWLQPCSASDRFVLLCVMTGSHALSFALPLHAAACATPSLAAAGVQTLTYVCHIGPATKHVKVCACPLRCTLRVAAANAIVMLRCRDKVVGSGDVDGGMAVRRGMFAFSFGKQQKPRQYEGVDPSQIEEQRRYITERSRDPKDVARMRQQKRGGR